jgi:hypothetical protein
LAKHVPTMCIFLTLHFEDHTMACAPTGFIADTKPRGWSWEHFFAYYLNHFITYGKPCIKDPAFTMLGNHKSHIQIPANSIAKVNEIIILTLPPHTSHKLQPCKSTIFDPYEACYNVCLNGWMFSKPSKLVIVYTIAGISGKLYSPNAMSKKGLV